MRDPTPILHLNVQLENGMLPADMLDWLDIHIGCIIDVETRHLIYSAEGWDAWGQRSSIGESSISFKITDPRKATLFKLRWA